MGVITTRITETRTTMTGAVAERITIKVFTGKAMATARATVKETAKATRIGVGYLESLKNQGALPEPKF